MEVEVVRSLIRCDPPNGEGQSLKRGSDDDIASLVMTKGPLMTTDQMCGFQSSLDDLAAKVVEKGSKGRTALTSYCFYCSLGKEEEISIESVYEEQTLPQVIKTIVRSALEAASELDGKKALGSYSGRIFVARYHGAWNLPKGFGQKLHHDYRATTEQKQLWKKEIPYENIHDYSFLTVVTDSTDKKHGWEGGHLAIQLNSTRDRDIPFNKSAPFLDYSYPMNEGILLRNRDVAHQVQYMKGSDMKRDLVIVTLDKEDD